MKKLYVGNLPFSATEGEVESLFGQHGSVHSVALINDRETGRPRGFGFVEMSTEEEAKAAAASGINAMLEAGWPGFHIEAQLPLESIAEAHSVIEERRVSGRVVVTI